MPEYKIVQHVSAPSKHDAVIVANEGFVYRNYGFPYTLGDQKIEESVQIDTAMIDRIVKRVIAGIAIYYFSKSMKNWAKE